MQNKIGWLVPSHPPRKVFLENLISSFTKHSTNVDLIVVWTRKDDNFLTTQNNLKNIYLDDYFSAQDIELFEETRSIINVKKIFGIMNQYQNYGGLICTDDELEFVRDFTGSNIRDKFSDTCFFPAIDISEYKSKNRLLRKILMESSKLLISENDRKIIKTKTFNYSSYGWFADLPYYESDRIPKFLDVYGLKNYSDLRSLNFLTFDYILYQFSCLLNNGSNYKVIDWEIAENYGAYSWFECFHFNEKGKSYAREFQQLQNPMWSTSKSLLGIFPNAICVFHTDRKYVQINFLTKIKGKIILHLNAVKRFLINFLRKSKKLNKSNG